MNTDLTEPHRSEFVQMLQRGAGAQDIYGEGVAPPPLEVARPAFVQRELGRVSMHLRGAASLLAAHGVRGERVLDVGCSTGGTTAAVALNPSIGAREVIGVDPNGLSIDAARVRAVGLGLADKLSFRQIEANAALPFEDGSFDLVMAVSVLEFIPTVQGRERFLGELRRVTRKGGHIYIATPSRWVLRELHTDRWLGNFVRRLDRPWASGTHFILHALDDCQVIRVDRWLARQATGRMGLPQSWPRLNALLAWAMRWAPWQKHLLQRRL
ncbi:MAG: class I SAM-dependent methyltransferase [Piscinibacter sp.]